MKSLPTHIKEKVCRVVVEYANEPELISVGSGFFVTSHTVIAAAHVVIGREFHTFFDGGVRIEEQGKKADEARSFFNGRNATIKIQLPGGEFLEAIPESIDPILDVVSLRVSCKNAMIPVCAIDTDGHLDYGDTVAFGGFSDQYGYAAKEWPFVYHTGIVAAFPKTVVAGGLYEHIRIHSLNLPGNSGAPLFETATGRVVGIVNGNMNWGRDNLASIQNIHSDGSYNLESVSNRIPLSVTYATPIKLIASYLP